MTRRGCRVLLSGLWDMATIRKGICQVQEGREGRRRRHTFRDILFGHSGLTVAHSGDGKHEKEAQMLRGNRQTRL